MNASIVAPASIQLSIVLASAGGRHARVSHEHNELKVVWDRIAEGHADSWVAQAALHLEQDGQLLGSLEVDGDVWRELHTNGYVGDLFRDVRSMRPTDTTGLKPREHLRHLLRGYTDWMVNRYEHDKCDVTWTDEHSCACDDECPECGTDVSPVGSDVVQRLSDDAGDGSAPARLVKTPRPGAAMRDEPAGMLHRRGPRAA